jgi:hypothetical protein
VAYCTIADIKEYLRPNTSSPMGAGDDALITRLIAAAQKRIDRECGRSFEAVTATRVYHAIHDVCGRELTLDADLLSITTLTNGDGQVIPSTAYVLWPANSPPYSTVILKSGQGYVWQYVQDPENAISVLGAWGYTASPEADIVEACVRLASFLYKRATNTGTDADRATVAPDGQILMPARLPSDVREFLAPYKRRSF